MVERRACLVVTLHTLAWQEQLDGGLPSTIDGRRLEDRFCNAVVCRIVDKILQATYELRRLSRGARLNRVGYLML